MSDYSKSKIWVGLPDSVKAVVKRLVDDLKPDKIILFGSRARGDHRPNSDFDLCVVGGTKSSGARAKVRVSIEEDPISLQKVDILFFDELAQDYLDDIAREGQVLYG